MLDTISGKLFFSQLLQNTKEGYLADPVHSGNQTMASRKLIGFPARADFIQVMENPDKSYPLGPVSISGKYGAKMTIKKEPVDVVIVGFGWAGSLMAMELASTGLKIVALERGEQRDTYPDFAYPRIIDELTYGVRLKLFRTYPKRA